MTHGGKCAERVRRPYDIYLYPDTPACVVNVLRCRTAGTLELRTIFSKRRDESIAGARTARVAITGGCVNKMRNNVVALHARSKRMCVTRSPYKSKLPALSIVTTPVTIDIASEDQTLACEEYPVLVLMSNKWIPCVIIDDALAPTKSKHLVANYGLKTKAQLLPHVPPGPPSAPVAVVQICNGRISRAWEYFRSDDTCEPRSAVVYSTIEPTAVE